ncbi:unnamed protein product, partial [Amoebophrya sp. A25]
HISKAENLTILTALHDKLFKIVELILHDLLVAGSGFTKNMEGLQSVFEGLKNTLYNSSYQLELLQGRR